MKFSVGDVVTMKKGHPCGGNEWEILRVGIDFRLKCKKCGHLILINRQKFEKGYKKTISNGEPILKDE